MINSEPPPTHDNGTTRLVASGPIGAAVLAGVATAIVLAIWVGFYFFVFAPRSVP
jgi:asparagine N-glycosylation enzyme membrane subunit Stt3